MTCYFLANFTLLW